MYSDEYSRSAEMLASFSRKEYKMLCPVCGRYYEKWYWRTPCCGAEIVWEDKADEESIDYELGYEKGWADGYAEGLEVKDADSD